MEAKGGRGGIAPSHSRPLHQIVVSGQCHAPAALYPWGKDSGTGGWVGPEPVSTQRLEEKSFFLCRGSNFDRPVVQSVVRHLLTGTNINHKILAVKSLERL
jgi:hypothetical protein